MLSRHTISSDAPEPKGNFVMISEVSDGYSVHGDAVWAREVIGFLPIHFDAEDQAVEAAEKLARACSVPVVHFRQKAEHFTTPQ